MIIEMKIKKSLNGRSATKTWSNSHFVETAAPLGSDDLRVIAQNLVNIEKTIHTTDVFFLNVHMKQKRDNFIEARDDNFVTMELDDKGTRVATPGNKTLPLEIALEIKRDADIGYGGRMFMRGCLTENMVEITADNSYKLNDIEDMAAGSLWGGDGINGFDQVDLGDGTLVLPNKRGVAVDIAREIRGHRVGGVIVMKTTRRRQSDEANRVEALERSANNIFRDALEIAGDLAFAALPLPQQLAISALKASLGVITAALPAKRAGKLQIPALLQ